MNMDAVLVTGGTGFIGRYVIDELLSQGKEVYMVTTKHDPAFVKLPTSNLIVADVTEPLTLPRNIKTIVHCAGVISDEKRMWSVNVDGTANIVNAAMSGNCRLVHLSSAGVTGPVTSGVVNETSSCSPVSLYERSKWEAEKVVLSAVQSGLQASILRPTIVFGVGRDPSVDSFLHLLRAIKSGTYRNIASGKGIYNIVHAREVARGLLDLDEADSMTGETYFINTPITFNEFASIAAETLKCRAPASLSYPVAFCAAAVFSVCGMLSGRKMPFTWSRLAAMTTSASYSQQKLLTTTSYAPSFPVDAYIVEVCNEYSSRGLL